MKCKSHCNDLTKSFPRGVEIGGTFLFISIFKQRRYSINHFDRRPIELVQKITKIFCIILLCIMLPFLNIHFFSF